ncbi:HAD-like domain-containing protein [Cryomyces antarcticus]
MSASHLPAMKTNPKFIMFTDFDGTITLQDSNDFMTDNIGYGQEKRKRGNNAVLEGRATFRDSFKDIMDSIKTPFPQCVEYLVQNIKLDPHFTEFLKWALENNIPVVVLSSGMEPVIRGLLSSVIGPDSEKIAVISNQARARPGKAIDEEEGWEIEWHDDSDFGHDKSLTIRPYANLPEEQRPILFYAGDGVSDLSAARETDLLFAREGKDLVSYCVRENVPFTVFEDWSFITSKVKEIVAGKTTVHDAAREGYEEYKKSQTELNGHANGYANGHAR